MPSELDDLLKRVHHDITTFDYDGIIVPCIVLPEQKFDQMMIRIAGKPISVDTNLNILQDGQHHVFVEMTLTFSNDICEVILLNVSNDTKFFEMLAKSSILGLCSSSVYNQENVFMIQLPRPERVVSALKMIHEALK